MAPVWAAIVEHKQLKVLKETLLFSEEKPMGHVWDNASV